VPQCDPWQHPTVWALTQQWATRCTGAATAWDERFFESADGLRLHYRDYPTERGNPARLPVLCLHGLTRNSRDFEQLAPHLQRERRVLAADLRGRGQSARDPDWRNYQPGVYLADLAALLDDARAARVVIVGTSLGGLLAMLLAAREPARVAGIVLNDIGPEIDPVGRTRIATYVGRSAPVRNWDEAVSQARATYGSALPEFTDSEWLTLARRSYVEVDGVPRLDMDAMIGEAVRNPRRVRRRISGRYSPRCTRCRCWYCAASSRTCCPRRRLRAWSVSIEACAA
jgi:pimeloyl-ACP methyl ester carboxylesterase